MTGYGETGPLKDKAGYDQVLQAMSGMCVLQGKPDGAPEIVYGSIVDYYAAALVAAGVASALFERERSGQGQFVGVSLLRSALTMQSARMIWAEGEALDIWRDMRSGGITGLHPTREGYLYLSANTPHFWKALCEKTGLPELANDPRYDTVRKRAQHAAEIVPKLRAALMTRTALEWEAVVRRRGAVRGGAADRGHVRSSASARRRDRRDDRASDARQLSRRRAADQVRTHAGAGAVRRAGAGAGFRCGHRSTTAASAIAHRLLPGRTRRLHVSGPGGSARPARAVGCYCSSKCCVESAQCRPIDSWSRSAISLHTVSAAQLDCAEQHCSVRTRADTGASDRTLLRAFSTRHVAECRPRS